ncbi:heterogeneous nuclear ribonucleoprotein K-like [Galendromus occidentalis]|uniref:Heterogeneous nuclear ribonucleoprotein K-like n=1 Tax=Galendromus occidentalis TaxID=34638 RepID=A0AAJ6QLU2_9ACAR|nr:heterogeneous nuclear ribonucleoprotein K-like [Galendromus occidentalis]
MFRRFDGPPAQRKRSGGGDDLGGGVAKRSKTDGVWDLRFLIPSQRAGAIIGKSGKQIVELRSTFNCKLVVPDCEGVPERLMLVRVNKDLLPQLISSVVQKITANEDATNGKNRAEMKLLLHQKEAVALIGKGGARIKDIREKTQAAIKIFDKTCPLSSDKVVRITGSADVVTEAIRTVCEALENEDVQISDHYTYDPANYEPYTAYEWGGMDPADENFALSSNPKARGGPAGGGIGGGGGGGLGAGVGAGGGCGRGPPGAREWPPSWPPHERPPPCFNDFDYNDYPAAHEEYERAARPLPPPRMPPPRNSARMPSYRLPRRTY